MNISVTPGTYGQHQCCVAHLQLRRCDITLRSMCSKVRRDRTYDSWHSAERERDRETFMRPPGAGHRVQIINTHVKTPHGDARSHRWSPFTYVKVQVAKIFVWYETGWIIQGLINNAKKWGGDSKKKKKDTHGSENCSAWLPGSSRCRLSEYTLPCLRLIGSRSSSSLTHSLHRRSHIPVHTCHYWAKRRKC